VHEDGCSFLAPEFTAVFSVSVAQCCSRECGHGFWRHLLLAGRVTQDLLRVQGPLWSDSSPVGAVTAILRLTHLSVTAKRGHGGQAPMVGRLLSVLLLVCGDNELNPG